MLIISLNPRFDHLRRDLDPAIIRAVVAFAMRCGVYCWGHATSTLQFPLPRYLANSSFALGMVASIADKLTAMKQERDVVKNGTGRDLVVLKTSVVDAELARLD